MEKTKQAVAHDVRFKGGLDDDGLRLKIKKRQSRSLRVEIVGAPGNEPVAIRLAGEIEHDYHYWCGASGRRYLHTVFPLLKCPEIPKANYIIVSRGPEGAYRALQIGQTVERAGSLNLAHLRHRAAKLGASEVHIHLLAETPHARNLVEADLRARHGRCCPIPVRLPAIVFG